MEFSHAPVMVQEVLDILQPGPRRRYLDGTLGGGGHAEQVLANSGPNGQLLGLDRDEEALAAAGERLQWFGGRVVTCRADFTKAGEILGEMKWGKVDGILLDLGISSYQLSSTERGFSFQSEARLDMRMDRRQTLDAFQVVNDFPVNELEQLIRDYGEEPRWRRIALAIDASRREQQIVTTRQLAEIIRIAVRGGQKTVKGKPRVHPATRTFQAIRIAVNRELELLETFLKDAYELLLAKGRMVVISFHSLEDRLVKRAFAMWARDCVCPPRIPQCCCGWSKKATVLTPRPLLPSSEEIRANPRARSAKLRAVEGL